MSHSSKNKPSELKRVVSDLRKAFEDWEVLKDAPIDPQVDRVADWKKHARKLLKELGQKLDEF